MRFENVVSHMLRFSCVTIVIFVWTFQLTEKNLPVCMQSFFDQTRAWWLNVSLNAKNECICECLVRACVPKVTYAIFHFWTAFDWLFYQIKCSHSTTIWYLATQNYVQWKWMKILTFSACDSILSCYVFLLALVCLFHFVNAANGKLCNLFCIFVIAINPWNDTIDYRYVQLKLANAFTIFFVVFVFAVAFNRVPNHCRTHSKLKIKKTETETEKYKNEK